MSVPFTRHLTSQMNTHAQNVWHTCVQRTRHLDWVTLATLTVLTIFVAFVNPSNTPPIFSNTLFKTALFAFVSVVLLLDRSAIGVMFAVAMVLPIVYSALREGYSNPFVENFVDECDFGEGEEEETPEDENDVSNVETEEDVNTEDSRAK